MYCKDCKHWKVEPNSKSIGTCNTVVFISGEILAAKKKDIPFQDSIFTVDDFGCIRFEKRGAFYIHDNIHLCFGHHYRITPSYYDTEKEMMEGLKKWMNDIWRTEAKKVMEILVLEPTERELLLYNKIYPDANITKAHNVTEYTQLKESRKFDLCVFISDWFTEVNYD